MSPSEEEKDRLEFETLKSRTETRENSTLGFSAITTASFVILSFVITKEAMPGSVALLSLLLHFKA